MLVVDLVDRADVWMVQGGRRLGFPLKTAEGLRVVGEFVGKELQGDVATELEVFRFVHHTHAPAADLAEDAVMGNRLPDGLGRRGHWGDMLGVDEGKVNVPRHLPSSGQRNHAANSLRNPLASSAAAFKGQAIRLICPKEMPFQRPRVAW